MCGNGPDEAMPYGSAHLWKEAVSPTARKAGRFGIRYSEGLDSKLLKISVVLWQTV